MSAASQVDWRSSHIGRAARSRSGSSCQLPALLGPLALGAVHVQRQTDDDELCLNIFCRFADLGRHFRAAFFRDLGRDGGGQKFGDIAGGRAGAAVHIDSEYFHGVPFLFASLLSVTQNRCSCNFVVQ